MQLRQYFIAFTTIVISFTAVVISYPYGAPVCTIGSSAVNNLHLEASRNPQELKFADGIQLYIANRIARVYNQRDPTFSNIFQAGSDNNVVVKSLNNTYMKGILAILHGGDYTTIDTKTTKALSITDDRLQLSDGPGSGCANYDVAAIIQKDSSIKQDMAYNLRWDTCGTKFYMDTNIVKNNNGELGSQFYYDSFRLTALDVPFIQPDCGVFNLNIFCPLTFCGFFGRLLNLCDTGPEKYCPAS